MYCTIYAWYDTGWPKSCDPNFRAYCGQLSFTQWISHAMDLSRNGCLPFVSHSRIIRRWHKNWFIFVHSRSSQSFSETPDPLLLLILITSFLTFHILNLTLKKWKLYLLRWLRYKAESMLRSWRRIRWSAILIRRWDLVIWHAFTPMGTSLIKCPNKVPECHFTYRPNQFSSWDSQTAW